ncbi:MAG TPA: response regulator transcription factor [Chloroflexi bacterium]|nr:response regulator transcription factor [Chloroflexota bacterium]
MRRCFRVLVVDDHPDVLAILKAMLVKEGFEVVVAPDALSGIRLAYEKHPDAILLDVMLPDLDGFEACRRLRDMTEAPIIFVTAKGTIEDIVKGLSLGADDYVVKPFERTELLSRLSACLRRAHEQSGEGSDLIFPATSIMLDSDRHELLIENRTVYLTPREFEVLRLMVRHTGKVLSADAILTRVWGPEWIGEPDLIKQYIYRLRQKIEPDPASPQYLHTVRGGGYYFDAEDLR